MLCNLVDNAVDSGFWHIEDAGYNPIGQSMSQPVNIDKDSQMITPAMVLIPLEEPLQTMHGFSAEILLQLGLHVKPQTQDGHVVVQPAIGHKMATLEKKIS